MLQPPLDPPNFHKKVKVFGTINYIYIKIKSLIVKKRNKLEKQNQKGDIKQDMIRQEYK